jgi:N-sulfoglucosamine sulfohydrolase
VYTADEVTVPKPLPDLPEVREEVAQYASSMRRLDDTVGRCLDALDEAGVATNTVVMFVSDNGMPMPFGKFDTYRDSLRGPLVARWPGRFTPGTDNTHLVSLTDIAPTIVDIAGSQPLPDIDGRSLVPLIDGAPGLVWRDVVVGTRYEDIFYGSGINRKPDPEAYREELRAAGWVDATDHASTGAMKRTMNKRGITDGTYHYIYNHFYNANNLTLAYPLYMGGRVLDAMKDRALVDEEMAARMEFFNYRSQEEFYNTQSDPGSQHNLIGNATVQEEMDALKKKLLEWMIETNDPVLEDYQTFLNGAFRPPAG